MQEDNGDDDKEEEMHDKIKNKTKRNAIEKKNKIISAITAN